MNIKRYVLASIAVYVAFELVDFIVHGNLLQGTYQSLPQLWRPDMMSQMWIMYSGTLVLAFIFTYIFIKGYEGKGAMEGVRFGVLIGLYTGIPFGFFSYALYPIPSSLAFAWFLTGVVEAVVAGIVAAMIYRK